MVVKSRIKFLLVFQQHNFNQFFYNFLLFYQENSHKTFLDGRSQTARGPFKIVMASLGQEHEIQHSGFSSFKEFLFQIFSCGFSSSFATTVFSLLFLCFQFLLHKTFVIFFTFNLFFILTSLFLYIPLLWQFLFRGDSKNHSKDHQPHPAPY